MRFTDSTKGYRSEQRRRRGLVAVVIVAIAGVLLATSLFVVTRSRAPILPVREAELGESLLDLWDDQDYAEVLLRAEAELASQPFDELALTLRGFARFYLGVRELDSEARQDFLIGSVQDLRRVLLLASPALETQVHYILGKAYFHRGQYFYDSAIDNLRQARANGLEQLDLLEYLALASRDLGRLDDAAAYFREAIAVGDAAIHRVTLADMLLAAGSYSEADLLLEQAIDQTNDVTILQHALLSLGDSQLAQGDLTMAEHQFQRVLETNSASADAHFGLGETFLARGETEQARFQWREAVRLDPNHIESLQRLRDN